MENFAALLRGLMAERGLGVRGIARQVPCNHALVSRLRSGEQVPSAVMAQRLDEVLAAGGRLVAARGNENAWESLGPEDAAVASGPALLRAITRVTIDDLGAGTSRDGFSPQGASDRAAAVLRRWDGAGRQGDCPPVMVLTPRQVGLDELTELEATADAFRKWSHQHGGGLRRKAVVGQLNEIADILREPHPPSLRSRLFGVTAKLALVAGHMSADCGRGAAGAPYRYYSMALSAGREAGNQDVAARAVSATARQLLADGRARDAVGLLRLGQQCLREIEADSAALLVAGEAWGYAHLGRPDAVASALDCAVLLTASIRGDSRLFGPAEMAGISGACFELLALRCGGPSAGKHANHAAEQIMAALDGRERFYVRSHVLDLLGLASVRITQREPREAVETASLALGYAAGLRSARVSRRFHHLAVRGLEKFPKVAEISQFAEQVRAGVAVT